MAGLRRPCVALSAHVTAPPLFALLAAFLLAGAFARPARRWNPANGWPTRRWKPAPRRSAHPALPGLPERVDRGIQRRPGARHPRAAAQALLAGDTNQQAIQAIVNRYGQFVLLKPPVEPATYVLWFAPGGLLLIGLIGMVIWLRRRPPPPPPRRR